MTKKKALIVISVAIVITVLTVIIGYSVRKTSIVDTSKLAEQNDDSKIEIVEEERKLNTIKTQEINEANLLEGDIRVEEACIIIEEEYGYKKKGDYFHLTEGSQIRVEVTFSEAVFSNNDYIDIDVNGTDEKIRANVIDGGANKKHVYQCVIRDTLTFNGNVYISSEIIIPENFVRNRDGRFNMREETELKRRGNLWQDNYSVTRNKIYIDARKPKVSIAWVHVEKKFGYQKIGDNLYLKEGDTVRIGVKFDEDVYDQYRK